MLPCCFDSVPSGNIEWPVHIILIKYSPSEVGPLMDKHSAYERILPLTNLYLLYFNTVSCILCLPAPDP